MIYCKELDKSFATKREMFDALLKSRDEIISLKKSAIKNSDGAGFRLKGKSVTKTDESNAVLSIGDVVRVVINTTNYLDSHGDLHVNGIWAKSANEQNGKIFHAVDHNLLLGQLVGWPRDVEIEVAEMPWTEMGIDVEGNTEALIFNTKMTDKTNRDAFMAYRDGEQVQHSVRMQYVNLKLALNDPESEKAYEVWKTYYDRIMNKDVADERGYFWVVTEAKIYKEGSTVLFGSNDITPSLGRKSEDTQPPKSTQPDMVKDLKEAFSNFKL